MSRRSARRELTPEAIATRMKGITVNRDWKKVTDEAPQAYKDINLVVDSLAEAGLVKKVAVLKPMLVLKG